MKTSARNLFPGTVERIATGSVNDEVTLRLAGGELLVALVTRESALALNLQEGCEAFALVKAPWIVLVTEAEGLVFSARNQLKGTVVRVVDGTVNAEVILRLAGGTELAAIVTRDSIATLGLAPGVTATALFKASHVLLAAKG